MSLNKTIYLITEAKAILEGSCDPSHDAAHAARVAANTERLSRGLDLTDDQRSALSLAAWWHDASRTIIKRPSFILMPLLDDTLSAIMLWRQTVKHRLFGPVAGLSTRLIFCKSLGTGKILTRLILRKRNRVLLDILKDADALDVFHTERIQKMFPYIETSRSYHISCRFVIWWMLSSKHLDMHTKAAQQVLEELIEEFLLWIHEQPIYEWFVAEYGEDWLEKSIARCEAMLVGVQLLNKTEAAA